MVTLLLLALPERSEVQRGKHVWEECGQLQPGGSGCA